MSRRAENRAEIVVGIDPGLGGAVAALAFHSGKAQFHGVWSMPCRAKKSGRREVDPEALVALFDELLSGRKPVCFLIEQVSAMPGQGVSGMFSLGDSFGVVRALADAYHSEKVKYISPLVWKKSLGLLKKDKSASLSLARRLFPAARPYLFRKKDEGRAEALLLAHYARASLKW